MNTLRYNEFQWNALRCIHLIVLRSLKLIHRHSYNFNSFSTHLCWHIRILVNVKVVFLLVLKHSKQMFPRRLQMSTILTFTNGLDMTFFNSASSTLTSLFWLFMIYFLLFRSIRYTNNIHMNTFLSRRNFKILKCDVYVNNYTVSTYFIICWNIFFDSSCYTCVN